MATGAIQDFAALRGLNSVENVASGRLWALWSRPTRRQHRAASGERCLIVLAAGRLKPRLVRVGPVTCELTQVIPAMKPCTDTMIGRALYGGA